MQTSSKEVVRSLLKAWNPAKILDAPSGDGWLLEAFSDGTEVHGLDLYAMERKGYSRFEVCDLDQGLPDDLPTYNCIVSCEGLEHFSNPGLFMDTAFRHLEPGGKLLITTPNVWYPAARLQYMTRGFFPSFPCLAGRARRGTHMHIMPWSFPWLHHFLSLSGFTQIELHAEPLSRAKHVWEKPLGWPQKWYCRSKAARAVDGDVRRFWEQSGCSESIYSRHLIVSATKP